MTPSREATGLRALVLAAGRGERLRPLTESSPKPLLPVLGVSILERTLRRLGAAGIDRAAVNLHHLGEQIPAALGDAVAGTPVEYWPEEELLGTLGPLGRLRGFFEGSDPVLMINGDSLCDWPVAALVRAHRARGASATLLLSSSADPDAFGGGVVVDETGRIVSFHGEGRGAGRRRGVFAGFHAISPSLLTEVEPVPSDIVRSLYQPALDRGIPIHGVFTGRAWHDLGTPSRYLEGTIDACRRLPERSPAGWVDPAARIERRATVSDSVIESGCLVGPGARIESSLLMPGASAGPECYLRRTILGPGVALPAGSEVVGRLLTEGPDGPVSTSL